VRDFVEQKRTAAEGGGENVALLTRSARKRKSQPESGLNLMMNYNNKKEGKNSTVRHRSGLDRMFGGKVAFRILDNRRGLGKRKPERLLRKEGKTTGKAKGLASKSCAEKRKPCGGV